MAKRKLHLRTTFTHRGHTYHAPACAVRSNQPAYADDSAEVTCGHCKVVVTRATGDWYFYKQPAKPGA